MMSIRATKADERITIENQVQRYIQHMREIKNMDPSFIYLTEHQHKILGRPINFMGVPVKVVEDV